MGGGPAYEVENLSRIDGDPDSPPVHYDQHLLRPHSITHAEAPEMSVEMLAIVGNPT